MTPHPDEGTLHAFIDGELSAGEATALEAHVAECAPCGAALAEARGFVAGASRAINALDAAPSSASRPVAARPEVVPSARPSSRLFVFRVPFARAAALLLLAGGSAVVINRSASDNGATSSAESLSGKAALTEDRASAAQPVETGRSAPANAAPVPTVPIVESDFSGRGVSGGVGAATQKKLVTAAAPAPAALPALAAPSASAASTPAAAPVAHDGNATTDQALRERAAAPPSAGAQSGVLSASGVAPTAATASGSVPRSPARMAASEAMSLPAATPAARVTRYRTRDGVTLTLTEEPLRTAFAEESTAARRGAARPMAQASAPVVNSYRWSSAEQGKSFTLTGALSIAELEATAKRLSELERVP